MIMPRVEKVWFVQAGKWEIKSFPPDGNLSDGHTVIRVPTKRGFQHIVDLDWGAYGDQRDAEELAAFICAAVRDRRVEQIKKLTIQETSELPTAVGLGWELSEQTKREIAEIEANSRSAMLNANNLTSD